MKKNNKGFSLVELIVVIAIMAILAAVAVIGVSVYIPKAQQASDKQLVSDIEYALHLAYNSGDLTEGDSGFIMLRPSEDCLYDEQNADMALIMSNLYGSDWVKTAQLTYDSWGVKNQMLSYADASAVVNSTFVQEYEPDALMEQVQSVINAVNGLDLNAAVGADLKDMFDYTDAEGTSKNAIDDVIAEYELEDWDSLSQQEQSNLLVLAAASSANNGKGDPATDLITTFSQYTAYAAIDPSFKTSYDLFLTNINNIPEGTEDTTAYIKDQYRNLQSAAGAGFNTYVDNTGTADKEAFMAIMNGVGNAMKDNGDAILNDLDNENMFTTGIGNEMYNNYLDSAYTTASGDAEMMNTVTIAMKNGTFPGAVLIQYAVVNGKLCIENSMPID